MQADGCRARVHQVATLSNFTSYANGIHGVELSVVGHVRLVGFKVADNVKNGIEIIETQGHWGGPKIQVRITMQVSTRYRINFVNYLSVGYPDNLPHFH